MNILLYSIFDIVFLLFAIVLSIALGKAFQPNPVVFVLVFLTSRALVYYLWLSQIEKRPTPWVRLAIQSILFLIIIPTIFALSSYFFPKLKESVFWFALIPAANFIPFILIHFLYKLDRNQQVQ
jgi:low temperature requirement protein LtrA